MKILLVGGGGREHALAWKISLSNQCEKLFCAPGNAGIEECAECVDIGAEDIDNIVKFTLENNIDLVIVGPEAPLVKGLADRLKSEGINVFGPSAQAAQLEGSKGFMKDLCTRFDIPTAAYGRFTDLNEAKEFIQKQGAPIVVKADGLAGGKGVIIAQTEDEAISAAEDMLSGEMFNKAGNEIVIEQFLDGEELSYFALSDGKTVLPLTSAQDHKRAYDGDEGPNTGGMGAYSPAHLINDELEQKIIERIIEPTINGMAEMGVPFQGILFAGVMVIDNEPYLLEHNVRFGDHECQAIMMRLETDLVALLNACATGELAAYKDKLEWSVNSALCVVMAAKGYPGSFNKDTVINLENTEEQPQSKIFHAGTKRDSQGQLVNFGGRVFGVTAQAENIAQARDQAYDIVNEIDWPEGYYRRDIGWRAIATENKAKSYA